MTPACDLYVGGHAWSIAGQPNDAGGRRCFTAVYPPPRYTPPDGLRVLLDSGAFSDAPAARLTPATALERQLAWEARAADVWGAPVAAEAIVSYDLLIDEVWSGNDRTKRRWSVADAERAVGVTVDAAAYLAARRRELAPRALVLSCQGVDAAQYTACVAAVLAHAQPGDWLGMGGWCIVGRWQSWLPEFRRTVAAIMPLAADAGLSRVHVFGVLWEPALAALVWHADQHGIAVSTDSTAPLLAATRGNGRKAGLRGTDFRTNIDWWRAHLAGLRSSRWYRAHEDARQLALEMPVAA